MRIVSLCLLIFLLGEASGASQVTRSYRLELANEIPESILLVEQIYEGQPAYTISYFVGAQATHTQVLMRSYFERYVIEAKTAAPPVEAWNPSQVIRCRQSANFSSQESGTIRQKRICFDALSIKTQAKFSTSYAHLKSVAYGMGD